MRWLCYGCLLALTLLMGLPQKAKQSQPTAPPPPRIGIIENLVGKVELRQSDKDMGVTLTKVNGPGYKLCQGAQVRCKPGSKMTLLLYSGRYIVTGETDGEQTIKHEQDTKTTIKGWYALPTTDTSPKNDARRAALTHYLVAVEFQRPAPPFFYSPTEENGVLRASTPIVGWNPTPAGVKLVLRIGAQSRQEAENAGNAGLPKALYTKVGIDGAKGRLDALETEELSKSLVRIQKEHPDGNFWIALLSTDGKAGNRVSFTMLSKENELVTALEEWKNEPGLLGYLGRAEVYSRDEFKLMVNAADEYDKAVEQYPENVDILVTAINFHRSIGNDPGGDIILNRLPPLVKAQVNDLLKKSGADKDK